MSISFIGDVHAEWDQYRHVLDLCEKNGRHNTLQLGDMGIFNVNDLDKLEKSSTNLFIRGNHDNPDLCRSHPNYLGDYGYLDKSDIFYMSGASSIDKDWRYPGVDWWPGEELDWHTLLEVRNLFNEKKPSVMMTHECPSSCKTELMKITSLVPIASVTQQALEGMFIDWKPDVWLFGHYHISFDLEIQGTRFICVNILDVIDSSSFGMPDLSF